MLCVSIIGIAILAILMTASVASAGPEGDIRAAMAATNAELEAMGEPFRVASVEYYTDGTQAGQIVYFDYRTKWTGVRWVPNDPRRHDGTDITWSSDLGDGTATGLTWDDTQGAISSAMATWDNVKCSDIPLVELVSDMDWGLYQLLWATYFPGEGYGGGPPSIDFGVDITHAGCLPGEFFDRLYGPGASEHILAVAFTFYFVDDDTGLPTDIDNNGQFDTAFAEIYYNNAFLWVWDMNAEYPSMDFESVVLHEAGHGLGQDHFGRFFRTKANDRLHWAPLAVMNAGYTGALQQLTGTDIGGHCSLWANWPNN